MPYRESSAERQLILRERLLALRERKLADTVWDFSRSVANVFAGAAFAVALAELFAVFAVGRCGRCGELEWSDWLLVLPLVLIGLGLPATMRVRRQKPPWRAPARFAAAVTCAIVLLALTLGVAGDRFIAPDHDESHTVD